MAPLPQFLSSDALPRTEDDIVATLGSPLVTKIIHFVLGPRRISNIPQACQRWIDRTGLGAKSQMIEGINPMEYLQEAMTVCEPGTVVFFWTCAVYGREKEMFFGPAVPTYMFYIQEVMPLDHMQLACTREKIEAAAFGSTIESAMHLLVSECRVSTAWKTVATHMSPRHLVDRLIADNPSLQWVEANSNGHAAELVAAGTVDLCITTETARQEQGLVQLYDFGCPDMVFFGGLTEHGAGVMRTAFAALKAHSE